MILLVIILLNSRLALMVYSLKELPNLLRMLVSILVTGLLCSSLSYILLLLVKGSFDFNDCIKVEWENCWGMAFTSWLGLSEIYLDKEFLPSFLLLQEISNEKLESTHFTWYFCGRLLTTSTGLFCNVVKCFIAFLASSILLKTESSVIFSIFDFEIVSGWWMGSRCWEYRWLLSWRQSRKKATTTDCTVQSNNKGSAVRYLQ